MLHSFLTSDTLFLPPALLCECFCIIPKHRSDIKIKNCFRNIETFPRITIPRLCPPRVPGEASTVMCFCQSLYLVRREATLFLFLHFFIYFTYSPRPLELKPEKKENKKERKQGRRILSQIHEYSAFFRSDKGAGYCLG